MLNKKIWQTCPLTALDSEPALCTDSDCWVVTLSTPPLILTDRGNRLGFTPGSRICVREKPLPRRGKRKVSSDPPVTRTGDLIATTEVLIIPNRNEIELYPRIRQSLKLNLSANPQNRNPNDSIVAHPPTKSYNQISKRMRNLEVVLKW